MVSITDRTGQQFGDYRLLRRIGGGGFGDVYLAEHVHDHSQAAVKVLRGRLRQREDWRGFLNEARTLRLRHPNIIQLFDFGTGSDDVPFLVMEYAPNGTLRERHPSGSRLPLFTIVSYVTSIASALQYAHDLHLVHRDVKPENMLVGDDNRLLLSDFGIVAVAHSSHTFNVPEGVGGTLPYMAPEQLEGKPSPASDQYALGIIVYEWITGRRPFHGTSVEITMQHMLTPPPSLCEQIPTLPSDVEQIIFTALAKDPRQRFASMNAFATALKQASMQTMVQTQQLNLSPVPSVSPSFPFASPVPVVEPDSATAHPAANTASSHAGSSQPIIQSIRATQAPLPVIGQVAPSLPPQALPRTLPRRGISRGRTLVLLGLALLILASASIVYTTIRVPQMHHQAGAVAHPPQNTDQAHATSMTAVNAYNQAVATQGIMFGFDAQHTHDNPYERVLTTSNVHALVQDWTYGPYTASSIGLVVANGIVYVNTSDVLYALNATSRTLLWSFTPDSAGQFDTTPVVAHGLVYVVSDNQKLQALNASGCGQAECFPLWSASVGTQDRGVVGSSPTIADGVIYLGTQYGTLYAFNASGCGKAICPPLWTTSLGQVFASSPVVANGVVYIGSSKDFNGMSILSAFNAKTGALLWTTPTEPGTDSQPAIANGVVYLISHQGTLYAFNAKTGTVLWTASASAGTQKSSLEETLSPAISHGIVYVGSMGGRLYAFNAAGCGQRTCHSLWSVQLGGAALSQPMIANGVMYIGGYALAASTGTILWQAPIKDILATVVTNGVVYFSADKLYAFHLAGTSP